MSGAYVRCWATSMMTERRAIDASLLELTTLQLCLSSRPEQLHEPLALGSECLGGRLLNIGEGSIGELGTESIGNLVSAPRVDVELDVSVSRKSRHTLVTPALTMA